MTFVLGPATRPVSTECSVGCCVHQTGIVSSDRDRRNDRSDRSFPLPLVHQRVLNAIGESVADGRDDFSLRGRAGA
jgi:hypothetical protein